MRYFFTILTVIIFSAIFKQIVYADPVVMKAGRAAFDTISTKVDDYIWPTKITRRITSSFGEFRSNHFHAGLDISTENKIGVGVFAMREGYVEKATVSPYGYGKIIVLKHPDGYYSTYAHLSRFNDAINKRVRQEQKQRKKLTVELQFDPSEFPVRQGDLIAYSGESGAGKAHLHFEIRDAQFNPVNPLLFPNIGTMDDHEPPYFSRIAVTPIGTASFVDHAATSRIYRAKAVSRSKYSIPDLIHMTGRAGFAVEVRDRSGLSHHATSVYEVTLVIDDSVRFTAKRDRFNDADTRQIGLDYDWKLYKNRKGRFQKLYISDGNTLSFYENREDKSGIILPDRLPEGKHQFVIFASDHLGNTSELNGSFILNHPPRVEITEAGNNMIGVHLPYSQKISSVEIATRMLSGGAWQKQERSLVELAMTNDLFFLDKKAIKGDIVRIVAKNRWSTRSFPQYYFLRHGESYHPGTSIHMEQDGDLLRVHVKGSGNWTKPPVLNVTAGTAQNNVTLQAEDLDNYFGVFRLTDGFSGNYLLRVEGEIGGKRVITTESYSCSSVTPSQGGSITSRDGRFSIVFEKNSAFSPLFLTTRKIGHGTYEVSPADVLLRGNITVMLHPERELSGTARLYNNSGSGWKLVNAEYIPAGNKFVARRQRQVGAYAVFKDDAAPVIRRWRTYSGGKAGAPAFSFSASDNFSGINPDEIIIFIDGERVIPEYDPEKQLVWYLPDESLYRGKYKIDIELRDRVGNSSRMTKYLTVK